MYPLAITMVFLTVFSILTTTQLKSFGKANLEKALHKSYIETKQKLQKAQSEAHFESFRKDEIAIKTEKPPTKTDSKITTPQKKEKKKERVKRPPPLGVNLSIPPNNSRLNFALLLDGHKARKSIDKFETYNLFAKLLRKLYANHPFFASIPNFEFQILDQLIANKEKAKEFTTPDELAKIVFDDPVLQEAFYLMMKGSSSGGTTGFPSLLFFTTFDKPLNGWTKVHHEINFMYAPLEIMEVIFENKNVIEALAKYRSDKWKDILYQEENRLDMEAEGALNRTDIYKDLQKNFNEIVSGYGLDPEIYNEIFDFKLRHPGSVLMVHDEKTGLVIREKLSKKKRSNNTISDKS